MSSPALRDPATRPWVSRLIALSSSCGAALCATVLTLLAPAAATAQVKSEPDGQWRATIGAGATRTTGNSSSLAANATAHAARATEASSLTFYGTALYGSSEGSINASRFSAGAKATRELGQRYYAFADLDWLRDRFANLRFRITSGGGVGLHLLRSERHDWNVFAGPGYSHDEYIEPTEVDNLLRQDYGRFEWMIGTESQHRPVASTTLHQRLAVYPAIDGSGSYRLSAEGGVSVAMTARLALTATLSWQRNSDPGTGMKRNDTLLVTGITFRLD